jgi:hypothetical protein
MTIYRINLHNWLDIQAVGDRADYHPYTSPCERLIEAKDKHSALMALGITKPDPSTLKLGELKLWYQPEIEALNVAIAKMPEYKHIVNVYSNINECMLWDRSIPDCRIAPSLPLEQLDRLISDLSSYSGRKMPGNKRKQVLTATLEHKAKVAYAGILKRLGIPYKESISLWDVVKAT